MVGQACLRLCCSHTAKSGLCRKGTRCLNHYCFFSSPDTNVLFNYLISLPKHVLGTQTSHLSEMVQGSLRFERHLNLKGFLEKSLKIKSALENYWKITQRP